MTNCSKPRLKAFPAQDRSAGAFGADSLMERDSGHVRRLLKETSAITSAQGRAALHNHGVHIVLFREQDGVDRFNSEFGMLMRGRNSRTSAKFSKLQQVLMFSIKSYSFREIMKMFQQNRRKKQRF